MTPQHHLGEATLIGYSAGALSPEMAAVAATHLLTCAQCRQSLADAESIGGALMDRQLPVGPDDLEGLRQDMLDRLDQADAIDPTRVRTAFAADASTSDADQMPLPLRAYFGPTWSALKWRWAAPGLHMIRATGTSKDKLIMLKVAPGRSMPLHSHHGTELTQILSGSYVDCLGHFGPGDAADLDMETQHQPVSSPGSPCICVAALDAPLKFPGWLARKLQPLVGL